MENHFSTFVRVWICCVKVRDHFLCLFQQTDFNLAKSVSFFLQTPYILLMISYFSLRSCQTAPRTFSPISSAKWASPSCLPHQMYQARQIWLAGPLWTILIWDCAQFHSSCSLILTASNCSHTVPFVVARALWLASFAPKNSEADSFGANNTPTLSSFEAHFGEVTLFLISLFRPD